MDSSEIGITMGQIKGVVLRDWQFFTSIIYRSSFFSLISFYSQKKTYTYILSWYTESFFSTEIQISARTHKKNDTTNN